MSILAVSLTINFFFFKNFVLYLIFLLTHKKPQMPQKNPQKPTKKPTKTHKSQNPQKPTKMPDPQILSKILWVADPRYLSGRICPVGICPVGSVRYVLVR